MTITHLEVADAKNNANVKAGDLLKVIRETPCFIWVRSHDGVEYQVSKKTHRINGTKDSFIKTANQPLMNF